MVGPASNEVEKNQDNPLDLVTQESATYFLFNSMNAVGATGMMALVFIYGGIGFIVDQPQTVGAWFISLVLGAFFAYLFAGEASYRVWRARFYDSYLRYGRFTLGSRLNYDQINAVTTSTERRALKFGPSRFSGFDWHVPRP